MPLKRSGAVKEKAKPAPTPADNAGPIAAHPPPPLPLPSSHNNRYSFMLEGYNEVRAGLAEGKPISAASAEYTEIIGADTPVDLVSTNLSSPQPVADQGAMSLDTSMEPSSSDPPPAVPTFSVHRPGRPAYSTVEKCDVFGLRSTKGTPGTFGIDPTRFELIPGRFEDSKLDWRIRNESEEARREEVEAKFNLARSSKETQSRWSDSESEGEGRMVLRKRRTPKQTSDKTTSVSNSPKQTSDKTISAPGTPTSSQTQLPLKELRRKKSIGDSLKRVFGHGKADSGDYIAGPLVASESIPSIPSIPESLRARPGASTPFPRSPFHSRQAEQSSTSLASYATGSTQTRPPSHRSDKSAKSIRRPPEIPSARESSDIFRPRRDSYAFRVPDNPQGRESSESLIRVPKLRIGRVSSSPSLFELCKRQTALRRKQIEAEKTAEDAGKVAENNTEDAGKVAKNNTEEDVGGYILGNSALESFPPFEASTSVKSQDDVRSESPAILDSRTATPTPQTYVHTPQEPPPARSKRFSVRPEFEPDFIFHPSGEPLDPMTVPWIRELLSSEEYSKRAFLEYFLRPATTHNAETIHDALQELRKLLDVINQDYEAWKKDDQGHLHLLEPNLRQREWVHEGVEDSDVDTQASNWGGARFKYCEASTFGEFLRGRKKRGELLWAALSELVKVFDRFPIQWRQQQNKRNIHVVIDEKTWNRAIKAENVPEIIEKIEIIAAKERDEAVKKAKVRWEEAKAREQKAREERLKRSMAAAIERRRERMDQLTSMKEKTSERRLARARRQEEGQ